MVPSYEQAEAVLQQIGQIYISDTTLWRQVSQWGAAFKAHKQAEKEQALVRSIQSIHTAQPPDQQTRKGVAMDGAKVYLREEGWKELKVGTVFEIETQSIFDHKTKEQVERGRAVNNSYVPHLGGPQEFGELMWAEAEQRDWRQAFDTLGIGDGALWIWDLVREHFYDSLQLVDWYHALEHLATSARLLYGDGTLSMQRWYQERQTVLYQGHADRIATELRAKANNKPAEIAKQLRTQAGYFQKNQRRMQYMELRTEGYPIGSGMVESACKQFKARFSGPGMRWSRDGIERLLPIRAAIMSRRFDHLWNQIYNPPLN